MKQSYLKFFDYSKQLIRELSLASSTLKMAPSSQVTKSQNSSKNHLFQELKNTLISK
jgi:hypothetical protein